MLKNSAIHTLSKGRKWSRRLMPVSDALLVRLMYRSKVSNKQNLTKTLLSEIQSRDTKWQDKYMLLPSINWLSFLFSLWSLIFQFSLLPSLFSISICLCHKHTHRLTHTKDKFGMLPHISVSCLELNDRKILVEDCGNNARPANHLPYPHLQ